MHASGLRIAGLPEAIRLRTGSAGLIAVRRNDFRFGARPFRLVRILCHRFYPGVIASRADGYVTLATTITCGIMPPHRPYHSGLMPDWRMTSPQRAVSSLMKAAASSGVPP